MNTHFCKAIILLVYLITYFHLGNLHNASICSNLVPQLWMRSPKSRHLAIILDVFQQLFSVILDVFLSPPFFYCPYLVFQAIFLPVPRSHPRSIKTLSNLPNFSAVQGGSEYALG